MAGKENLKPPRSTEEARERGRKGGKSSGVARRAKRDAKETALLLLNMAATGNLDGILSKLDIKETDRTNLMGIIARHVVSAQSGDVKSAQLILEIAGMLPKGGSENNFNVNVGHEEPFVHIYLPDNGRDKDE